MNNAVTREDQLAAAIAHAAILIPCFGAVIPLAIWLSQRERSPLLRFQALQALAYQLIGLLAYFITGACYFAGTFGIFPLTLITGSLGSAAQNGNTQVSPGLGVILLLGFLVFFGSILLLIGIQCIGGPVFVILALVGSWRVLNDKPFQYPLIGKWISRRLDAPQAGTA
jgi:uncharacterized Tic20 family protein